MRHKFTINVDHFQFYLEDQVLGANAGTSAIWNGKGTKDPKDHLAVAPGLLAVQTARFGGRTPVIVEVVQERPSDSLDAWDHVVECSINVPSGSLTISTPESDLADSPHITVSPGIYRVLVYYGNLTSVVDDTGTKGDDHYRLVLWPDGNIEPRVLK